MKAKKIMIIVLFVLIVSPFLYVQINKIVYDQRVMNYLTDVKRYKNDEIKSVKGVWGIKVPPFYAVVVFADEPLVEYIYFAHNNVKQFSYNINNEGKQKVITVSDLKHYDPSRSSQCGYL